MFQHVLNHASGFHQGIYPDLMHISDLQIVPDCIWSSLLELTDNAASRDDALTDLWRDYAKYCSENGANTALIAFDFVCAFTAIFGVLLQNMSAST